MTITRGDPILRHLRRLTAGRAAARPDRDLLESYLERHDEEAFATLVERYGPMVLAVCQAVLHHRPDAEDAFQATFLVLARKAGSIRRRDGLGSWLHGVAYRVAQKARVAGARRQVLEARAAVSEAVAPADDLTWAEVRATLHAELARLPERFRAPLVLCYLEGLTQEEAARRLGWTAATVKGRLQRGRERLRRRLERRGLGQASWGAAALATQTLASPVPPSLAATVVRAAFPATGAQLVSSNALVLGESVLRAMTVSRCTITAVFLLALVSAGTGVVWWCYQATQARPGADEAVQVSLPDLGPGETADPVPSSPLHHLDPKRIPPEDRLPWQPPELAAVVGEHRGRHWGSVGCVAFSPDAKVIASGGEDCVVRLWDAATLRERAVLKQHTRHVRHLAFSPDGKTIVSGGDRTVVFWDLSASPPTARTVHQLPERWGSLAFLPDGNVLAAASGRANITVWKMARENAPEQVALLPVAQRPLRALAFSPDGKTLAAGVQGSILLWDLPTQTKQALLETKREGIAFLTFSPDSKTLAGVGANRGPRQYVVMLWDVSDRTQPREKAGPEKYDDEFGKLRFSRDGKTLAVAGWSRALSLWDLTGAVPAEQTAIPKGASCLDFAPDGKTLVTGGGAGVVRLWDLTVAPSRERFPPKGHLGVVAEFSLARTGLLGSCGQDGTARLWDLSGAQPSERSSSTLSRESPSGIITGGVLALSPDGKTLAIGTQGGFLEVWDVSKEKPRRRFRQPAHQGTRISGIDSLHISPDGKVLVSGGIDGKVRFWDLTREEPQELRHIDDQGAQCMAAFAADGTLAAVANFGVVWGDHNPNEYRPYPELRLWDLKGTKPRLAATLRHSQNIDWAAFSADGRTLATGGGIRTPDLPPGELRLWRLSDPGPTKTSVVLPGHRAAVNAVAYSPDGQILASAGHNGQVILWEPATGTKYREWQLPGAVYRVGFAADGRHLITANANGTLYVLRLGQGMKAPPEAAVLWETLASSDAGKVYPAIWGLVANPRAALALCKERVHAVQAVDAQRIEQLIDRLNDERFEEREKATTALEQLQERAEPALRRRLAKGPSLEMRRRLERLLEKSQPIAASRLRTFRAIQVLEQIGNHDARDLLTRLAQGAPEALETQQARQALQRLRARSMPAP